MSLAVLADHMASKGRGPDSMLIHMSPREVQGLQALAQSHGGSLTVNPHTGLPEAGMLSDLFKAVAPIALGAFLGPAGLGMSSLMAGAATGGITALATGSLSRGLMAGLGAYGGAGLGEGLMNAGTTAMGTSASLGAGIPADMAFNLADAGVESAANVDATTKALAQAQPTAFDKVAAGAKAVTASPGAAFDFAKQNLGNIAAAATPIMAGSMVPTTTQAPTQDTGNIRKFSFDPIGQRYTPLGVFPAAGYKGMAGGGIVALANGGAIKMADGTPPTMLTDEQLFQKTGSWEAAAAARDAQNNALNQYNWQQQAAAQQDRKSVV